MFDTLYFYDDVVQLHDMKNTGGCQNNEYSHQVCFLTALGGATRINEPRSPTEMRLSSPTGEPRPR